MSRGRSALAAILAIGSVAPATIARADPTPADRALATQLFEDGRAEMQAGRLGEACPKLAESQRLDPGGGTLLNLAICHRRAGKTATAWAEFHDALAIADRERVPERSALAREQIAAMEPTLARLLIALEDRADLPELAVRRDGTIVARAAWGSATPIDPGEHVVEATAPGRARFSIAFSIRPGEQRLVSIPMLGVEPLQSPPPPTAPSSATILAPLAPVAVPVARSQTNVQRTAGFVVGGIGLGAIGAGIAAGLVTIAKNRASEARCTPGCTMEGLDLDHAAQTSADVSTVTFIAGAAAIGVGVVLIATSGRSSKSAWTPIVHF